MKAGQIFSGGFSSGFALVALLFVVSACSDMPIVPDKPVASPPTTRSPDSLRLEKYYASVQTRLQSQGLLRTDGGGPDAPFSAQTLADDFERIALFDEYAVKSGSFVAQQTVSQLRRWAKPVRIGIIFGDEVPATDRAKDRANVVKYAKRLARLSGLDIKVTDKNPNYHVLFMYKNELASIGPVLRKRVPHLAPIVVREIINSPRNTFCVAYAFSKPGSPGDYNSAIILIKAEHTGLMRLSCIHEEMAQALGLANDSPVVRPSIFNDDEEFALLTHHDELLLKMLYDPRLKPGMTSQMARPIVRLVARDVLKGSS